MNAIVRMLLEYFGYAMTDINFEWEKLTEQERKIFISEQNFETIVREYQIHLQTKER